MSTKEMIVDALKVTHSLSSRMIAEQLGLNLSTVKDWLKQLRVSRHIHISGWLDGSRTPTYGYGNAPDIEPKSKNYSRKDVLSLLEKSPGLSRLEIVTRLNIQNSNLGRHLSKLHAGKEVYISGWRERKRMQPIPLYSKGPGADVLPPKKLSANDRILALLDNSPNLSPEGIQQGCGVKEGTLRNSGYLRRLHDASLIYISGWECDGNRRHPVPLYSRGCGPDAPQPTINTPAKTRVLALLAASPGLSQQQISAQAFVSEITLSYGGYIKELREAGLIYVSGWLKHKGRYATPLFSCGNQPDAPRPRINQETRDAPGMRKILDVLANYSEKGGMTYQAIADLSGLSRHTVKNSGFLQALVAQELVHIGGWRCTRGPLAPLYVIGPGENAPKPRAATSRERESRSRLARQQRRQGLSAMSIAGQISIASSRESNQHWFSNSSSTLPASCRT